MFFSAIMYRSPYIQTTTGCDQGNAVRSNKSNPPAGKPGDFAGGLDGRTVPAVADPWPGRLLLQMMGAGAVPAFFQMDADVVVIHMGNRGKQNVHRQQLSNPAAHGAAALGDFRRGDMKHNVRTLRQGVFSQFRDGNDRSSGVFGQGQNLHPVPLQDREGAVGQIGRQQLQEEEHHPWQEEDTLHGPLLPPAAEERLTRAEQMSESVFSMRLMALGLAPVE